MCVCVAYLSSDRVHRKGRPFTFVLVSSIVSAHLFVPVRDGNGAVYWARRGYIHPMLPLEQSYAVSLIKVIPKQDVTPVFVIFPY